MSEQNDRLRAAGKVIADAMAAHERGEVADHIVLGFRLLATAHAMKVAHQPGALKIARDYCEAVGIDAEVLDGQVQARIYEAVQFDKITATEEMGKSNG